MKFLLSLVILVFVCSISSPVMAENLLKNGGFEEGTWSDLAAPKSWSHWSDSYNWPLWFKYNGWPPECRGIRGLYNGGSYYSGILYQMIDFTGGDPAQSVLYDVSISGWIWVCSYGPTIGNQSVIVFAGYPGDMTYGEITFEQCIVSFDAGSVNNEWVRLHYTGQLVTYGAFNQLCFAFVSNASTGLWFTDDWSFEITPVPEPSSLLVLLTGTISLTALKRRGWK